MLNKVAFMLMTVLGALVANASGYEATEEDGRVLVSVKQKQFEHILREIERQGAAARYSCWRYADNYQRDLASAPPGSNYSGVQVIRCFHPDQSSGAVRVSVSTPPDEILAVLYGVEGAKEKPLDGKVFLERLATSLQKESAVESACVLTPGEHKCGRP